jgi:hypothetical protein
MKTVTSFVLAGAVLAGCSGGTDSTKPVTAAPAAATPESPQQNLDRLRGLQIFEVRGEVDNTPASRLQDFTDAVVAAAALAPDEATTAADAPTLLAQLGEEQDSVVLGDLVLAVPATNPNCYNLPCPADRAAADATNADRAGRLSNIVKALKK